MFTDQHVTQVSCLFTPSSIFHDMSVQLPWLLLSLRQGESSIVCYRGWGRVGGGWGEDGGRVGGGGLMVIGEGILHYVMFGVDTED